MIKIWLAIIKSNCLALPYQGASSVNEIGESLEQGTLVIPSPNDKVKDWPIIGDKVYGYWNEA